MKSVSMQDLLEIYRQKNHCRDIVDARTKLEKVGRDMYEYPDTEVSSKGEYLLLRLQEWDEQQAKQKANTSPPPKQNYTQPPPKNTANTQPPQTNTATTPDGYNAARAIADLVIYAASGTAIFYGLVWLGGAVTGAAKGIANGAMSAMEAVTPYAVYTGIGFVALIGAKEFFTKKETPTAPNGPAGITVNHHYYGNGVVTNEQK